MQRLPVFYGVPESEVDEVLDRLLDRGCVPTRCLVFGTRMDLLGALCRQWDGQIKRVVAMLPFFDAEMVEPALTIAEREGFLPEGSVWVSGFNLVDQLHGIKLDVQPTAGRAPEDLASLLVGSLDPA